MNPYADSECYGCRGTGKTIGFGQRGQHCPCVAECGHCGSGIPHEDYDEGVPRQYDGLPACEECRTKLAAEDAATAAGDWWLDCTNIAALLRYLHEEDGLEDIAEAADVVAKPYNWSTEYGQMLVARKEADRRAIEGCPMAIRCFRGLPLCEHCQARGAR